MPSWKRWWADLRNISIHKCKGTECHQHKFITDLHAESTWITVHKGGHVLHSHYVSSYEWEQKGGHEKGGNMNEVAYKAIKSQKFDDKYKGDDIRKKSLQ